MKFIAALCLIAAVSAEADNSLTIGENGKYNFLYSVDDAGAHKREESGDGAGGVSGSYSYVDANGDLRKVDYKAGPDGFQPSGDIGVDRVTAEKAAEVAALAPKAPEVVEAEVKVPASPFTLPYYALPGIHHAPLPYAFAPRPLAYAHHPLAYAPHFYHW